MKSIKKLQQDLHCITEKVNTCYNELLAAEQEQMNIQTALDFAKLQKAVDAQCTPYLYEGADLVKVEVLEPVQTKVTSIMDLYSTKVRVKRMNNGRVCIVPVDEIVNENLKPFVI